MACENISSVLQQFTTDDVFKRFLDDNVDVKALASTAIQMVAVNEQLAKLQTGITLLDKELHDQVSHHHEDLLSQATEIETLESLLQMIQSRIQTLMSTAERLQAKVAEPFDRVANQTSTLSKLQEACDLLRRISRVLQLSQRLQDNLKGDRGQNITKAAQCLHELDYIIDGSMNLTVIKILEKDLRMIKESRIEVEKEAQVLLLKGIKNLDPNVLGTSLQVFYNLQVLVPTVQNVVAQTTNKLRDDVENALDVNQINISQKVAVGKNIGTPGPGPGGASMPTVGTTAQLRATFWNNVEKMTEDIYLACCQMQHLQKILSKKRDPVSHVLFADELVKNGVPNLMLSFWTVVTKILTETLSKAAKNSSFVSQAFEGQFPKLLRLYLELWKRLQQLGANNTDPSCPIIFSKHSTGHFDPEKQLRSTLSVFETSYLRRSSSTLLDKVNLAFLQLDPSSPVQDISSETKDLEAIVDTISRESVLANFDPILSDGISRNIAQTVQLLTEKCGKLVVIDEDAVQVIDSPKPSQILIAKVVHILTLFHCKMLAFLDSDMAPTSPARERIVTSMSAVENQIEELVKPLLNAVTKSIEAIIMTMHQEDFSGKLNSSENTLKGMEQPCSAYMRELQSFIDRCHKNYFLLYPNHPIVQKNLHDLASRAIELFVRHASLIRPLEEKGKMKLAADMAQMEMALAPICDKLGDLGKPYRMLRSFRPLLFQTPQHIASSPVVGDIVPYSIILNFLFSRGPNQLKSPHQASDWTIDYYSKWLDKNQSENKRLALIRSTLDAYAQMVKQHNEKEFTPIYVIMCDLLKKAIALQVEA